MFDKMTEIDSDPYSKVAHSYYSVVEQLDQLQKKRPSHIMMKTMKGTKMPQWTMGPDGNLISPDQVILKKKQTNYTSVSFPEINPFKIEVPDTKDASKKLSLASYRWPSSAGKRRAIV